jgi:hypothetical protein
MRRRAAPAFPLAVLVGLSACSGPKVTEDTPNSVAVHYQGAGQSLDDATAIANRACAAHGKVARLREVYDKAILDHVAHFTCVGG